jgi:uncharacterized SAM-binding protein YcdF (DUF218 family)
MVFVASKVLWMLVQPSTLLWLALVVGLLAMRRSEARVWGRRLATVSAVLILVAGVSPVSTALILPLEHRFPRLDMQAVDGPVAGIIVLGGAEDGRISVPRGQLHLNEAAERITEAARLARALPGTRLVFTGGVAALIRDEPPGASAVVAHWTAMGVPADRIQIETRSRNTYENAVFTRDLVRPKPGDRWLLVTSAAHMPRSVGIFRHAGFDVVPYPVDYRTAGTGDLLEPFPSIPAGLRRLDDAAREWGGLLAYWMLGRTSELFPAPTRR